MILLVGTSSANYNIPTQLDKHFCALVVQELCLPFARDTRRRSPGSPSQGVWTAALNGVTGLSTVGPSLILSPITSSAALVNPGQMLSVEEWGWGPSCSGLPPNDSGVVDDPVPMTRTMTVTNGWFVVDGSTLFVFLGGVDECGAAVAESFNFVAQ